MKDRREEILENHFPTPEQHPDVPYILNAMDEYMKECCLELLEYMAKYNVKIAFNSSNQPIFRYKEEWISKEQLFENFL